jgi:hypothetical protein
MNTPPSTYQPTIIHTKSSRITVDGQTAIMRECPDCGMVTPHKLTECGSACGICERESLRYDEKPERT